MANTYTQINIHVVICVQGRKNIITSNFRYQLFSYISGILKNINQYPLAINGHLNHIDLFFEMSPSISLSDIMRIVKSNSSKWINENKHVSGKFRWQAGYAAFSYAKSQRNNVIQYIYNQEEHHKKRTFKDEYFDLLKKFELKYDEQYLFDFNE